jgi:alkylation response protein AidB-like acyl-CoA dehydrogenase
MDFSFSDEQQMLLESTRRLLADHYQPEQRRRIIASGDGFSRELWQEFAAVGLLALHVPQEHGGLEAGPFETLLVSTALGEGLVVEPYLSSAVLATRAVVRLASSAQRADWLPRMATGELIAVLAHDEVTAEVDSTLPANPGAAECTDIQTHAIPGAEGWTLHGRKSVIYHAPLAGLLLVSARIAGSAAGELGLFAVTPDSDGVELRPFTTVDGQRAADIVLKKVNLKPASRLGDDVTAELPALLDYGTSALCAEALGALEKLLAMTLEYTRTRVQFGVPIGKFQALQHRLADMLIHVEQARSMAYLAASRCLSSDAGERGAAISAAKVIVGQAARFVGQQAIQLHGGMGMTDELAVGHYFKRLLAAATRFGSTDMHLERYARGL